MSEIDNKGREYRYQRDYTMGTQMFHVRCDDWAEFVEACANMDIFIKGLQQESKQDIAGPEFPEDKQETPKCGIHGIPMTMKPAGVSKQGKHYPAFWSCPQKNADGTWCNFKVR